MDTRLRQRTGIFAAAALAAALASPALAAGNDPMMITLDQAVVLRFPEAAQAVIVGNPSIADATILNTTTVVLTGRGFGTTNLIVLAGDGTTIVNQVLTVRASDAGQVTVFRRSTRETYSCNPICEPTLHVGDSPSIFDLTAAQLQTRSNIANAGGG